MNSINRLIKRPTKYFLAIILLAIPYSTSFAENSDIANLRSTGKAFASVAKKASPAVVFIQVEKKVTSSHQQNPSAEEFFKRFFGPSFPQGRRDSRPKSSPKDDHKVIGQGSGFIISEDGYILTNNHVVGDADEITVKLVDGRKFIAKIIGTDPHSDIAVIKIDAEDLPSMKLGDSDALEVGEWVVAIGNPFGLSHTITAGIVSAKGRNSIGLADYENFIQTDAAINPGNSGGPLVDLDGEAVGINTAIFSKSGGYMGIGFAIPINMVKQVKDQLINDGSVTRGFIGIAIQELTPELAKSLDVENEHGILISDVTKGSPADKAGLKQGDVIVAFAGKKVKNIGAFRNLVSLKSPDSSEKIKVIRNGKRITLKVKIGNLTDKESTAEESANQELEEIGISVQSLTPKLAEELNYQNQEGVVITRVEGGSIAARARLRAGMLIQEVNRMPIESVQQVKSALKLSERTGRVLLVVREGQYSHYVVLSLEK